MTIKRFLLQFIGHAALTIGGGIIYAIAFNIMVAANLMPDPNVIPNFGELVTLRTSFVLMAAILIGFIGIFMRGFLMWPLFLAPLYLPSLFAIFYTLAQN